jgi:hypothetical protein
MVQVSKERINILEKMMKLSSDDQTRHLNYLAKCPIEIRLDLFEKQREIFYPLSQKYKDHMSASDITYGALILAIGGTRAIEKKLTQKSFEVLNIDEIRDLSSMRAVAFKHKMSNVSHKHEKLMGYWAIVRTLRLDHGYSYERVSLFLKKKHRFSIAASTIMKKWKEIETPNTSENGL